MQTKSFRTNEIIFRTNEIIFRTNESFRTNEMVFRTNEISTNEIISYKRNNISYERIISYKRNNISYKRNIISYKRNIISYKRNKKNHHTLCPFMGSVPNSIFGQDYFLNGRCHFFSGIKSHSIVDTTFSVAEITFSHHLLWCPISSLQW